MSNYSFSQLIREILANSQGAKTQAYGYTRRMSNAGERHTFRTAGGTTVAHFFVAPLRSAPGTASSSRLELGTRSFPSIAKGE